MGTRIDWFNVGRDHWEGNQDRLTSICKDVEWRGLPCSMGFMQGEAIKTLIKELKIPKVSHVGDSPELAPFGLVGIRARYKDVDVEIFAVDEGTHVSPLCAFVTDRAACECVTETQQTVIERVAVA